MVMLSNLNDVWLLPERSYSLSTLVKRTEASSDPGIGAWSTQVMGAVFVARLYRVVLGLYCVSTGLVLCFY